MHTCPDCKAKVEAVWHAKRGFGFACECRSIWTNEPYPPMTT